MLRCLTAIALTCFTGFAYAAAGFGVGVGPGGGGGNGIRANPFDVAPAGAEAKGPAEFAYEPWVKNAKLGDYAVTKTRDGRISRKEVTQLDKDFVFVTLTVNDKPIEFKYRRKEEQKRSAIVTEFDVKRTATGMISVGDKKINAETWEGFAKCMSATMNGKERYKATKFQRVFGQGIPFDGVLKYLVAPDDGKGLNFNAGAGRVNNTNTTPELVFEVVEFGNVAKEKPKVTK